MAEIVWRRQDSIRIKVTDRCPWNCRWCHNEGTGARQPTAERDIYWDEETKADLDKLAQVLPIGEVHLTGGEPTSHPDLPSVVAGLRQAGFIVKATSIGCNESVLRSVVNQGLVGINFSVHSVEPELLLQTQNGRSGAWCKHQLTQLLNCITIARELHVKVKINTVMSGVYDAPRVAGVLNWAKAENVPLRIMNDLGTGSESLSAIRQFIEQSGSMLFQTAFSLGSSSYCSYYRLPSGYEFGIKRIRPHYLSGSMCSHCQLRAQGKCSEGFYGVRLEKHLSSGAWRLNVRLCVHKTDKDTVMTVPDFECSRQLAEIQTQLKFRCF